MSTGPKLIGERIVLPGLATAHSHAFQRALRSRTERLASERGSFWSWRSLMYDFASRIDEESIYVISRFAFAELAMAGVTAVGEFHYVHHDPSGRPYEDRTLLADAVIRAARDVGLRICLLRVLYERAGAGQPPLGVQERFSDADVDLVLRDVDALREKHRGDRLVRIGLAPHSVRAATAGWIGAAALYAEEHALPLHMHVSEQPREIEECLAEHRRRPVELLDDLGAIGPRFSAVHATHLGPGEAATLGRAHAYACICRTTERDLGDGLPDISALVNGGARITTGVDSHASSDPFEELRAVELDERTRTLGRGVAMDADALLRAGSADAYTSLGMDGEEREDEVVLDANDPALVGADARTLADHVVFAGAPRAVDRVMVGGRVIVEGGRHVAYDEIRREYLTALRTLLA